MSTPLILQIQASAIDGKSAVADALRQAKLACAKLGLKDFGEWVDNELKGYPGVGFKEIPQYRKLVGKPQSLNPYRGWQDILFQSQNTFDVCATVPVNTPIPEIELSLNDTDSSGCFEFPYRVEQQKALWAAMGHNWQLRVRLEVQQCSSILNAVRNILTDWTIELEKNGVVGEGLLFNAEDRKKSADATSAIVNNYHMGNVGALVQSASQSVIQGGVNSSLNMGDIKNLTEEIERQRENLPVELWNKIQPEITSITDEVNGKNRPGVIEQSLKIIGNACLKVGTSVAAAGIAHVIGQHVNLG